MRQRSSSVNSRLSFRATERMRYSKAGLTRSRMRAAAGSAISNAYPPVTLG
jgi:hypothetical protein